MLSPAIFSPHSTDRRLTRVLRWGSRAGQWEGGGGRTRQEGEHHKTRPDALKHMACYMSGCRSVMRGGVPQGQLTLAERIAIVSANSKGV